MAADCDNCDDTGLCPNCDGDGCRTCDETGDCQECGSDLEVDVDDATDVGVFDDDDDDCDEDLDCDDDLWQRQPISSATSPIEMLSV
jgi:hypothetical protein